MEILGTSGDDYRSGGPDADVIYGLAGDDQLFGGHGDDTLLGDIGNDQLFGGGGNDALYGGPGNDTLTGGDGIDTAIYIAATGPVTASLAAGSASGGEDNDLLVTIENLLGSAFGDVLTGDAGDNLLSGAGGHDTLQGGAGSDLLDGGDGFDTVLYDEALSRYTVIALAQAGAYTVIDNQGGGTDTLAGVERLLFAGVEWTPGGPTGAPTVLSFSPADGAGTAPVGTDIVLVFSEAVRRGSGNIVLRDATTGAVIAAYDAATSGNLAIAGSVLTLNPARDLDYGTRYRVEFAAGSVQDLQGNAFAGTSAYQFTTQAPPAATQVGTGASETVVGSAGDDRMFGLGGDDLLQGGAGDDYLDGGSGADRMEGGLGADTYIVDDAGDQAIETDNTLSDLTLPLDLGSAIDKVIASISFTLGNFVENLDLAAGAGALAGTGNALANVLVGNDADNLLRGLGGNDTIDGGAGIDTAGYENARAGYALKRLADGSLEVRALAGSEGTDLLTRVERLQFADGRWAVDFQPEASGREAALVLGAVLGKAALGNPGVVGLLIRYFDTGVSMAQACSLLVDSGIVRDIAGGADNAALVRLLFQNLFGVAADAGTTAALTGLMAANQLGQAQFLQLVTELELNQVNVDLVGLGQSGLAYL